MKLFWKILAFGVLVSPFDVQGWTKSFSEASFVGPEIYYVKRNLEGGAWQNGVLYGVRGGYDHIKRYHFYWGGDVLWTRGTLKGQVQDAHLKSEMTDANIEARFGYTLQSKCWRCASFTPYFGIGYFWEKNHYRHPSPLHLHFNNQFSYIPVGFLSQIFITPTFSVGLNFKARLIYEGSQRVSHDPEHKSVTQHYDEKTQYRMDLPMIYYFCYKTTSLAVGLEPFYEYRLYGHRTNFPFDFFETKIQLYGATLKCLWIF